MKKKIVISVAIITAITAGLIYSNHKKNLDVLHVGSEEFKNYYAKKHKEEVEEYNKYKYDIYEFYLDEMCAVAKKYDFDLKETYHFNLNHIKKPIQFSYYNENEGNIKDGDIIEFNYGITIDEEYLSEIYIEFSMRITNKDFDFENSKFNEFRKIFTDEKINYAEINNEINEAIEKNVSHHIEISPKEYISIDSDGIVNYYQVAHGNELTGWVD